MAEDIPKRSQEVIMGSICEEIGNRPDDPAWSALCKLEHASVLFEMDPSKTVDVRPLVERMEAPISGKDFDTLNQGLPRDLRLSPDEFHSLVCHLDAVLKTTPVWPGLAGDFSQGCQDWIQKRGYPFPPFSLPNPTPGAGVAGGNAATRPRRPTRPSATAPAEMPSVRITVGDPKRFPRELENGITDQNLVEALDVSIEYYKKLIGRAKTDEEKDFLLIMAFRLFQLAKDTMQLRADNFLSCENWSFSRERVSTLIQDHGTWTYYYQHDFGMPLTSRLHSTWNRYLADLRSRCDRKLFDDAAMPQR